MDTGNRWGTLFGRVIILKNKSSQKKIYHKEALQAHGKLSHIFFQLFCKIMKCLERVFLRLPVAVKASVSIEASIVMPIFMFAFLEILSLLNYLSVYSGVLYALKMVGEPISIYGYAQDMLVDSEKELSLGEEVLSSVIFSEGYLDCQIKKYCQDAVFEQTLRGGRDGIRVLGSYIDTERSCLSLIAWYTVKPVVDLAGTNVFLVNRYYIRMWTGYSLEGKDSSEKAVYITENGTVYHVSRDCTHLRLSVRKITPSDLQDARNDSGGKYSRCEVCFDDNTQVDGYFITNSGERYHAAISCSGLKRTIYAVEPKEVAGWPMCSRCGKKEG